MNWIIVSVSMLAALKNVRKNELVEKVEKKSFLERVLSMSEEPE